ncbi:MAG: ArsA family ATPase [Deltaproteobacteria bacterium]|nr:ArsA family ATPase [Deltaproteobacteria bacterium]
MDMNRWLDGQRLVVCVGSGGVGKTTTAASIGVWAAARGRKVMVLTIDPAKRLANSLGLDAIGGEGARIDLSPVAPAEGGSLHAMMLDSRGTFDAIIGRVAPTEELRDRVLSNTVYRYMADSFASSQDYMATEKLYDLVSSGQYDLVVLDTPPVKNALDFLESPGRVVSFFDERVYGWFVDTYDQESVKGGFFGRKLMASTSAMVWKLLSYVLGEEFLGELASFFKDFQALYEGFRERHDAVLSMLRAPGTAFVSVCAPNEASIEIARYFQGELSARALPSHGVIVNQVHRCEGEVHDAAALLGDTLDGVAPGVDPSTRAAILARLGMAHRRLAKLAQGEQELTGAVRSVLTPEQFYREVPRLEDEVHELGSLYEVGKHLFEGP